MWRTRSLVAVLFACFAASSTACGGNDDGGDGGGSTPELGTCDRRDPNRSCIELHGGSAIDMENQEEGCTNNGFDWSNEPCPTEELVGCCEYTYGNDFRECFYTDVSIDPEMSCAMLPFGGSGVWTPAD